MGILCFLYVKSIERLYKTILCFVASLGLSYGFQKCNSCKNQHINIWTKEFLFGLCGQKNSTNSGLTECLQSDLFVPIKQNCSSKNCGWKTSLGWLTCF